MIVNVDDMKRSKVSKKSKDLLTKLEYIESDLNPLDHMGDQKLQVKLQDNTKKLIRGKFRRRKRIPNMFQVGEFFNYMYENGHVAGVEYWAVDGVDQLVDQLVDKKSKSKNKLSKQSNAVVEEKADKEPQTKTFIDVDGISAEIVSKKNNVIQYVFHFKPLQEKEMTLNLAELLEINPITSENEALELIVLRKKKKRNKEKRSRFVLGDEQGANLKKGWKYSLKNILDRDLMVGIDITNKVD